MGPSLASRLFQKAADLYALDGEYRKAIGHYEKLATGLLETVFGRWRANKLFLKAGICHLATNDKVYMRLALEKYQCKSSSLSLKVDILLTTVQRWTFISTKQRSTGSWTG
jgi:hypothetical protein